VIKTDRVTRSASSISYTAVRIRRREPTPVRVGKGAATMSFPVARTRDFAYLAERENPPLSEHLMQSDSERIVATNGLSRFTLSVATRTGPP
jgi:hypothetical protein